MNRPRIITGWQIHRRVCLTRRRLEHDERKEERRCSMLMLKLYTVFYRYWMIVLSLCHRSIIYYTVSLFCVTPHSDTNNSPCLNPSVCLPLPLSASWNLCVSWQQYWSQWNQISPSVRLKLQIKSFLTGNSLCIYIKCLCLVAPNRSLQWSYKFLYSCTSRISTCATRVVC